MGTTAGKSFDEITARLDEIVAAVRSKDTSLERSLDLFDEAIALGAEAVEMVDSLELDPREEELLAERAAGPAADAASGSGAADGAGQPGA